MTRIVNVTDSDIKTMGLLEKYVLSKTNLILIENQSKKTHTISPGVVSVSLFFWLASILFDLCYKHQVGKQSKQKHKNKQIISTTLTLVLGQRCEKLNQEQAHHINWTNDTHLREMDQKYIMQTILE